MGNKKIGIVIPTYNRPEILKSTLFTLLKECIDYNIPIYIVDDSTNNDTKIIVEEIIKISPPPYYFLHKKPNKFRTRC